MEQYPFAAVGIHPLNGMACQLIDVHIARRDHVPSGRDPNLGLAEVLVAEPDCMQHGPAGSTFDPIDDLG